MSARAARLLAIPYGLLAFGLGAIVHWLEGPAPRLSHERPWLFALAAVASFGAPLGAYLVIARRRPASLRCDPDRRRFVALSSPPRTGAPAVIMLCWLSGRTVADGALDIDSEFGIPTVFFWFAGILAAMAAAALFVSRPTLSLTPTGVTIVALLGRRVEVDWDEIESGEPRNPARRNPGDVTVRLRATQTLGPLGGFRTSVTLPTRELHVDPLFLAAAIRHYAEDPTHREEIGTKPEHERLRDVLRPPREPDQLVVTPNY